MMERGLTAKRNKAQRMPVRPRIDGAPGSWWIDFRVGGKRYRLTRQAPNKRAAQALERQERSIAEDGFAKQRRAATVADAFKRYWQEHGRFLDRDKPPKRREYVTDSTINHRLLCLQGLWNRAEDLWGWRLPRMPWRRLKLHMPAELPDRSMSRPALRELLRVINPRSRAIIMAARVSGLRRGALLRLQPTDLDWEHEIIRAISKGRAGGKLTPVQSPAPGAGFYGATACARSVGCSPSRSNFCGRIGRKLAR
jgi:integrase